MAPTTDACLNVIGAGGAIGRQYLQFGFMRRFDQSYAEMKSALTHGTLGQAQMMHNFHRNVETPAAGFTGDMAITNSAPHESDIARFILKADFSTVSAFAALAASGARFSIMNGYLRGRPADDEGAAELLRTARETAAVGKLAWRG